MCILLEKSCQAWDSPAFEETFKREVQALDAQQLQLHRAMQHGNHPGTRAPSVILLGSRGDQRSIEIRAGVLFSSVIGGCNCADDPSPLDEINEYCEMTFHIDRVSGETRIDLD